MSKQFLGVIVAIILIFVGIFALTGQKSDNGSGGGDAKAATNNVLGTGTTGVTLVEYGDFQCPYCQQYYPTVKQVKEQFGDQIKFQYRNFPLQSVHPNAFAAARAAQAAGLQNKYWEMHDILYENNDPNGRTGWVAAGNPNTFFEQFAKQIGLNVEKYKTDFASSRVNDAINADIAAGNKLGITGTPSFFLNGKKVTIDNKLDAFTKIIQAEIDKKKGDTSASTEAASESAGTTQQSTGTSSQQ